MGSARKALLDILEGQPGKKMCLTELSKELDRQGVLGFGVEAKDVVYALREKNKVLYDCEKEVVYLLPNMILFVD